ncbi:MAG TPA: transposase [Chryseolinea sp.]|nr:transposase [Chryseolinea sp.]
MTKRKVAQPDLIDLLLADYQKPEDLIGENGILKQLTKAIVERALQAELAAHLGHDKHEAVANDSGNTRNGSSAKTLKGDFGALPLEIPRDRDGSFEPQLIAKHQTRWTGFDDKILSLYARGMTVREIQSHIQLLRKHSCSVFEWILEIMATVRKDQGKLGQLFQSFYSDTRGELWDSEEALCAFFENEENYKALMEGTYGANLMAKYTFLSRMECFDEWMDVVFRITQDTLVRKLTSESEKKEIAEFFGEFKEYCLRVKNIARFFEDGFEAEPFTMKLRYDFNEIDPNDILKANRGPNNVTFAFSDTSKAIIANIKQDKNWRYKLQQLIRIKNGAESLYPRDSTLEGDFTEYVTSTKERVSRDQSWRL